MRNTVHILWAGLLLAAIALPTAGVSRSAAADRPSGPAWLGVYTQDLDSELRDALDHPGEGVLVNQVVPDSPADKAGLRQGDIIERLNQRALHSAADLVREVRNAKVGQSVSLQLERDGRPRTVTVTLAARPSDEDLARGTRDHLEWRSEDGDHGMRVYRFHGGNDDSIDLHGFDPEKLVMAFGRGRLGVRVENLNGDLGDYFDVHDGKGALVVKVLSDTPAEKAGLRAGDVIRKVGDQTIGDTDDLVSALEDQKGSVSLTVLRKGQTRTIEAELEDSPQTIRLRTQNLPQLRKRIEIERGPGADDHDLRQQLEDLRREVQDLKRELESRSRD